MSARDKYHNAVKNALIKDGWTITRDPYTIHYKERNVQIDLSAERLLLAEKDTQQIAVEIKTFSAESQMWALENAIGQYMLYRDIMEETQQEPTLYLAIPTQAANGIFAEPIGELVVRKRHIALIIFDAETEEIIAWKP